MGDDSPGDVAQQWLSRYKDNNPASLAELINFVLRSAGCNIEVTVDDVNDTDNIDGRIGDLQQEFQEVSCGGKIPLETLLILYSKILPTIPSYRRARAPTRSELPSWLSSTNLY